MKQNKTSISILSNLAPKVFSLLVAVFIVLAVHFMDINDRVVRLPLDVILPDDYTASSLVPSYIDVAITGSDRIIYLVDPSQIHAYADFSGVSAEGITRVPVMLVYDEDIFKSDGMTVSARPSSVRILFSEKGK